MPLMFHIFTRSPVVEELEKKNRRTRTVEDMEGFEECAEKVPVKFC